MPRPVQDEGNRRFRAIFGKRNMRNRTGIVVQILDLDADTQARCQRQAMQMIGLLSRNENSIR